MLLTVEAHEDGEEEVEDLDDNEEVEVGVVVDADAIVDPVAVVVESFHTLVTDVAVSRVCRAYDFALGAEDVWVGKFLYELEEWHLGSTLHVAWIFASSEEEE